MISGLQSNIRYVVYVYFVNALFISTIYANSFEDYMYTHINYKRNIYSKRFNLIFFILKDIGLHIHDNITRNV